TKLAGLTDMTVCCICESSVSAREHTNARPGKWFPGGLVLNDGKAVLFFRWRRAALFSNHSKNCFVSM
ncbi:MAG: hypothetical protein ACOYMG_13235, partial [Candidatus Methylumidiphilus sp.]